MLISPILINNPEMRICMLKIIKMRIIIQKIETSTNNIEVNENNESNKVGEAEKEDEEKSS